MTNPVHLLSVAALLLVAFLVGAVIGSLARAVALRQQKPVSEPAKAVEAAAVGAPLVAAPVIAPLPVAPAPIVPEPAEVPVPDFAATLIALADEKPPAGLIEPARPSAATAPTLAADLLAAVAKAPSAGPAMQPAHVAGHATSGIEVAAPRQETSPVVTPVAATSEAALSAEVIPFPSSPPEPPAVRLADMVVGGETVAIVDASDLEPLDASPEPSTPVAVPVSATAVAEQAAHPSSEDNFRFVPSDRPGNAETSAALEAKADTIPIPDFAANAPVSAVLAAALPLPEIVMPAPTTAEPAPQVVEPVVTAEAVQSGETVPAESEPEPGPETAGTEALDEDAAMRAIEGGWTPRRSAPKRIVRAVEAPEGANEAVAAAARAVTAARRTAEAVVAEVAEVKVEAGRPAGLDAPRDGRKDDLTHIIGVLPVIETALNKLGIYHFDQVSELTDENIGWIEGHLGVPGRIARELWREQARELSAVLRPKRAAEK